MISAFVRILKPLLLPLLKLRLSAPHLPEGTTLVRHLKPAEAWLGLRYARVLLAMTPQLVGIPVAIAAAGAVHSRSAVGLGLLAFLYVSGALIVSLVITRIDFELRHYLVGDRSLRVSEGAIIRREVTLSYANVQNLEVIQGPIERLFGLKSLMVSTAGGGGGSEQLGRASTHQVTLAGIVDADQVRELILGMVKKQRDAGLGEPAAATGQSAPHSEGEALLLAEIRDAAVTLRDAARTIEMPGAPGR